MAGPTPMPWPVTRIHVISLPHTLLTQDYAWCAYSMKVVRFAKMLGMAGRESVFYGPDVHETPGATEYVPIVFPTDRKEWFGAEEWDTSEVFNHWDAAHISWQTMNARAAHEIRQRWQPGDLLGIIGGRCQQQIVDLLADVKPLVVEWGVGYSGTLSGSHKVYESYAWAHHVAGFYRTDDVQFFDTVIPNCFDLEDFVFSASPGQYLLYMGRPNPRKGLPIIAEIAARYPGQVIMAGQPGELVPHTTHVGVVTGKIKAELLAGATALLTPTTYLEPFGGVAVEALLSGTPVISTDWGAFSETVIPGMTGFRCRTLAEFLEATVRVENIDRTQVRAHAEARYTTRVGSGLYHEYLTRVETLYGDGWYAGV